MCATIPVYLAYLAVATRVREPRLISIALGSLASLAVFALGVVLIGWLPLTRLTAVPFAAVVCFSAARLVRRLPDTAPLVRVRTSAGLLLVRAGVSAVMVIAITSAAHVLGAKCRGWWRASR